MVINDKYKFIFFHVPKAAGTSVMHALQSLEGNNNRLLAKTKHETLSEFSVSWRKRRGVFINQNPEKYFRFAFVRNPWVRMYSFYTYLKEMRPRHEIDSINSFQHFLLQSCDSQSWVNELRSMKPQLDYFMTMDGAFDMDFVGHFEFLQEDLKCIGQDIGVDIKIHHLNRTNKVISDYRECYDQEMIKIVSLRFQKDIETFGYTFEEPNPTRRFSGQLRGKGFGKFGLLG